MNEKHIFPNDFGRVRLMGTAKKQEEDFRRDGYTVVFRAQLMTSCLVSLRHHNGNRVSVKADFRNNRVYVHKNSELIRVV